MILLSMIFVLSLFMLYNFKFYKLMLNKKIEERIHFLTHYYNALEFINHKADKSERIYFAGSYRYYLRPDLFQCLNDPGDNAQIINNADNPNIWENSYQRGFNYILVQKGIYGFVLKSLEGNQKPDWLTVQKIYDDQNTTIFSLVSNDSNHHSQCSCQTKNQKLWESVYKN